MSELKRSETLVKRKFMEYFVPTVLTAMATNIAVIVDATIVGNILGSNCLAAVNLLSPVIQLYFSLSILFGLASSTIMARVKGRDGTDTKTCNEIFTVTMMTIAIISVLLMVIQGVFIDNIVNAITSNEELAVLVKDYYIPTIIGTPITLFMTSNIHIVRTDGRPKFASNIIIVSNVINLIMDFVTIKGFNMGIMGSSIATVTGNFVGLIMVLTHFRRKENTLRIEFSVLKNMKLYVTYLLNLLTTGISGAFGTLLITVKMLFLNSIIQSNGGKSAIVAYSVVSMCQVFVSAFITGASQTMIPIVSLLSGEGDLKGVKTTIKQTVKILLVSSILIVCLVEIFPGFIAGLYGIKQAKDLNMAITSLRISSLLFPALAMSFFALYYFMSNEKKISAIAVSVVNGIAFVIPFAIILAKFFGIKGVWWALVLAQYATVLYAVVTAIVIKATSNGKYKSILLLDESKNEEILSFTYSDSDTKITDVKEFVKDSVTEQVEEILIKVLEYLSKCETEKNRKSNITDVRICNNSRNSILIKNSGANIKEQDIIALKNESVEVLYSKSLGFNQIKIMC